MRGQFTCGRICAHLLETPPLRRLASIPTSLFCAPCSLAILTDAAHLLSDVSGFGVSLFAAQYAARKSHSTHTFGYHRVEVSIFLAGYTEPRCIGFGAVKFVTT